LLSRSTERSDDPPTVTVPSQNQKLVTDFAPKSGQVNRCQEYGTCGVDRTKTTLNIHQSWQTMLVARETPSDSEPRPAPGYT
jgi:hypothetical protein